MAVVFKKNGNRGNYLATGKDCIGRAYLVSYNPCVREITGNPVSETAVILEMKDGTTVYLTKYGDHRKAIRKLNSLEDMIAYIVND